VAIVEKYLIVLIDIVTTQSVLPEQGNTDCVVTMSIKTIKYFSTIIVAIVEKYLIVLIDIVTTQSVLPEQG
ncbi:hypothetical protein PSZ11_23980, partial [Shigella flexneri]|nr:hypothetical protein [Shigella flexneri]